MNESTKDKLKAVLGKYIEVYPAQYNKQPQYYLKYLLIDVDGCRDESILSACKEFWDKELWDKPLNYFKAIVKGKEQEYLQKKIKENRQLGGIPTDVA